MPELLQNNQEILKRILGIRLEIREEFQKVKITYDRYRNIRELMGKNKKSLMDFNEIQKNTLQLLEGEIAKGWLKTTK